MHGTVPAVSPVDMAEINSPADEAKGGGTDFKTAALEIQIDFQKLVPFT